MGCILGVKEITAQNIIFKVDSTQEVQSIYKSDTSFH